MGRSGNPTHPRVGVQVTPDEGVDRANGPETTPEKRYNTIESLKGVKVRRKSSGVPNLSGYLLEDETVEITDPLSNPF